MKITILTICPQQFESFLETPLVKRNLVSGLLDMKIVDIREYAPGSFRHIDDSPFGGGPGMLMRCQPVVDALEASKSENSHTIILSPCGTPFKQKDAHRLAHLEDIILICGHYEGFDERIYAYGDEIISIGDYILCGGELPAMVISEAIMRLVEGSMKKDSVQEESFEEGLLEYPQYTKPYEYRGEKVPDILLSGDHEKIRKWRYEKALEKTKKMRPDLLEKNKILQVDEDLKDYIEKEILPCYKDYEKSHGIEHIKTVINNSFELIQDLDVDVNKVYCIAAYHDIGIRYGRKDHELTSGKWLYEDKKLDKWFTNEEKVLMKEAVEDHRASRKEKPRSIYGCIVAEADRDVDPERIVERCVIYETSHHPGCDLNEAYERVMEHMEDKYSEHGYLKLWMPCKKNEEGLNTLRTWMKNGEIKAKVEKYFAETKIDQS
ncbi:MAG: tRNA (guanosine(37)-N1)-methyltransferase TrmD [Erysipelotrichaceae bacterium]|nr:tRNA (guanosine(37)-N1)-methyltransferase TrmD [Erysipelotrichaceae bacterium]